MSDYKIISLICLGLAVCACGKKAEQGAAGRADAAAQVGVSTGSALGSTLNAPANYMRGMQGNVEKAEKAAALAEKAAAAQAPADADSGN